MLRIRGVVRDGSQALEDLQGGGAIKGQIAEQEGVPDASKCPDVDLLTHELLGVDVCNLRCSIHGGARVCDILLCVEDFLAGEEALRDGGGAAKVAELVGMGEAVVEEVL